MTTSADTRPSPSCERLLAELRTLPPSVQDDVARTWLDERGRPVVVELEPLVRRAVEVARERDTDEPLPAAVEVRRAGGTCLPGFEGDDE